MADYLHGIENQTVDDTSRPVQVKKAGVIGIVGTAGKGPVNTPVLLTGSPRKAAQTFGNYNGYDVDGFTLPESFAAIFGQAGATVVAINVCDPATHNADVAAEVFTLDATGKGVTAHPFISAVSFTVSAVTVVKQLTGDSLTLPAGATNLIVKSEDEATTHTVTTDYTFAAGVLTRVDGAGIAADATLHLTYDTTITTDDYTLDADTGTIVISKTKVEPTSTLAVDYTHVDPTAVTEADIIGAANAGGFTGTHALKAAQNAVGVTPRILIAPRWTHQKDDDLTANGVVASMVGMADGLRAMIYADAPNTTDADAVNYRKDWDSKRIVVLEPFVTVRSPSGETISQPRSAFRAGLAAKLISEEGWHVLPSNRQLANVLGTARDIDGAISDKNSQANYLNENEIAVAIRLDGWREWGGRTTSSDPAWQFESVVRITDMIQESILMAHLWAVDRNITKNFVGAILESVNSFLRQLKVRGVILGGKAWIDPELNTEATVANGELYVDFEFTPPYPAEHIIFRSHLVNTYIEEVFNNGPSLV